MHFARLAVVSLVCGLLAAQDPTPKLPTLERAGVVPEGGVTLQVLVDGSLVMLGNDKVGLSRDQVATALRTLPGPLVVHADREARAEGIGDLLSLCVAAQVGKVFFAVQLPDASIGTLVLALPAGALEADCVVRLHREREGLPPAALVPLVRRLQGPAGTKANPRPTFALACPGDVAWAPLLKVMAAMAESGVESLLVRCTAPVPGAAPPAADELLAMDVGPTPWLQVPRLGPGDIRPLSPARPVVGFAEPPTASRLAAGGRIGGRYGGRAGDRAEPDAEQMRQKQALANGLRWLGQRRGADGACCDDAGRPDVEATALSMLAALSNGASLNSEAEARSMGWLLSRQDGHGGFCLPGPGQVRSHAVAVWALAEASAISPGGGLLRGAVRDGLDWLIAARRADGGWNDGRAELASDTITTAWCSIALSSARFYHFEVPVSAEDQLGFFDLVVQPDGSHHLRVHEERSDAALLTTSTAGALFSRFALGQSSRSSTVMQSAIERLLASHEDYDPLVAYWGTQAMYQAGGDAWLAWLVRARREILDSQHVKGEFVNSWNPAPGSSRATATALRVLTLASFDRYVRMVVR
jgi:hypothetical protein